MSMNYIDNDTKNGNNNTFESSVCFNKNNGPEDVSHAQARASAQRPISSSLHADDVDYFGLHSLRNELSEANLDILVRIAAFAKSQPNKKAFIWLADNGKEERVITFGELYKQAEALANYGKSTWKLSGEEVLLIFFPGIDFIVAILACLMGGFIAMPIYPPDPGNATPGLAKLEAISRTSNVKHVLTNSQFLLARRIAIGASKFPKQFIWHNIGDAKPSSSSFFANRVPDAMPLSSQNDIAFIQFTSGSTSEPKGVVITRKNLNANLISLAKSQGTNVDTVCVIWVPFYHDMGLIGGILLNVFAGSMTVMMSPVTFIKNPFVWVSAISTYRGTVTAAPNFAYELVIRKITPEQKKTLNLSSCLRYLNGAEPVRAETIRKFAEVFASCGFKEEHWDPSYGMAENVVLISTRPHEKMVKPLIIYLKPASKTVNSIGSKIEFGEEKNGRALVGNGEVAYGSTVIVVHPENKIKLEDEFIGEIWVTGPSKVENYYGDKLKEISNENLNATLSSPMDGLKYLRTGDMGFIYQNQIFVCGRIKDMMIVNGKNVYPQDVELTTEKAAPNVLRAGCVACFCLDESEDVVIVAELKNKKEKKPSLVKTSQAIESDVLNKHGLKVRDVVLIPPRSIPKTTSGKIRRKETKTKYLDETLPFVYSLKLDQKVITPKELEEDRVKNDLLKRFNEAFNLLLSWDLHSDPKEMLNIAEMLHMASLSGVMERTEGISKLMKQPYPLNSILLEIKKELQARPLLEEYVVQLVTQHFPEGLDVKNQAQFVTALSFLTLMNEIVVLSDPRENNPVWKNEYFPMVCNLIDSTFNNVKEKNGDKDERPPWFYCVKAGTLFIGDVAAIHNFKCNVNEEEAFQLLITNILEACLSESMLSGNKITDNVLLGVTVAKLAIDFDSYQLESDEQRFFDLYTIWNAEFSSQFGGLMAFLILFCPKVLQERCLLKFYQHRITSILSYLLSDKEKFVFLDQKVDSLAIPSMKVKEWCRAILTSKLRNKELEIVANKLLREKLPIELSLNGDDEQQKKSLGLACVEFLRDCKSMTQMDEAMFTESFQMHKRKILDQCWEGVFAEKEEVCVHLVHLTSTEDRLQWLLSKFQETMSQPSLKVDDDLFEMGLTSIQTITICSFIEKLDESMSHNLLSGNAMELLSMGRSVMGIVKKLEEIKNENDDVNVKLPRLNRVQSKEVSSMFFIFFIQFLGIVSIFFMMSISILPAYVFGYYVRYDLATSPWSFFYLGISNPSSNSYPHGQLLGYGILLPLVTLIWMFTFTLFVLLSKWVLIFQYKEEEIAINSLAYFRWWFVDRLVHFWEMRIGIYFLETPLINIFYILMGANIQMTTEVNAFVREFDLITIGDFTLLNGAIYGRVFDHYERTVRFRKICIGSNSKIFSYSVVFPGSIVESNAMVPTMKFVRECSIIRSENFMAEASKPNWVSIFKVWKTLLLKSMFMVVVLYSFFYLSLVNLLVWNAVGAYPPMQSRYTPLFFYVCSYYVTMGLASILTILVKWVLLGKRLPGPIVSSQYTIFAEWACKFCFTVCYRGFLLFFDRSRTIMWYPRALGSKIGKSIFANIEFVSPGKADYLQVGDYSFVSFVSLLVGDDVTNRREIIKIGNHCEVGLYVMLGPSLELKDYSSVGALTEISRITLASNKKKIGGELYPMPPLSPEDETRIKNVWSNMEECFMMIVRLLLQVFKTICLIPAYEFASYVLFGGAGLATSIPMSVWETSPTGIFAPVNRNSAIVLLAISLMLASICLVFYQKLYTSLILGFTHQNKEKEKETTVRKSLYCLYGNETFAMQGLFAPIFHGTIFFNLILRWYGADIPLDAIVLSRALIDHPYLTIGKGVIIDEGSIVMGHQMNNYKLEIGHTIMEEHCYLQPWSYVMSKRIVEERNVLKPLHIGKMNLKLNMQQIDNDNHKASPV